MVEFVSDACRGEKCWCGIAAVAKVEEVIFFDDPVQHRHPRTCYVCEAHFMQMMRPGVAAKVQPVALPLL